MASSPRRTSIDAGTATATATGTPVITSKPLAGDDEAIFTHGHEPAAIAQTSALRKYILLAMFTCAEFLDAFNNSALFPAIPTISRELDFLPSETGWMISAYQLTFAAFLLVSGRISDVYSPKPAFIAGASILGLTHLGGGFVRQKIALLVLRALGGIGGALTIPSALTLIVQMFPKPAHQAAAIAVFGMAGGIGNILGVIIGALFVQYTSWPWVFWFTTIFALIIAGVCFVLIPNAKQEKKDIKFDATGVAILTSAMILFIFAVTSSTIKGWDSAYVLAPLLISLALAACFFVWEAYIDPLDAVLPPRMWRYTNFAVIVGVALMPYFWWVGSFILLTNWYQEVFGWSVINASIHFLPLGIAALLVGPIAGQLPKYFHHKWIILGGTILTLIGTLLLPFTNTPDHYWRFAFPGFVIGSIGCMFLFANSSIAIFASTPPEVAGIVGAVFNSALQLGSAVGLAALTSIYTSVKSPTGTSRTVDTFRNDLGSVTKGEWDGAFKGRAAAFWFLAGIVGLEIISVLLFFHSGPVSNAHAAEEVEGEGQMADLGAVEVSDEKKGSGKVSMKTAA